MYKDLSSAKQTLYDHGLKNQNFQSAVDNLKCLEHQLFLKIGELYVENSMLSQDKTFGPEVKFT
jgi:hypothetical protein